MNEQKANKKLDRIGQSHLLACWDHLTSDQKNRLLNQIDRLDSEVFLQQQHFLQTTPQKESLIPLLPFTEYQEVGSTDDQRIGKELIAKGQAGVIILAGGQGTRLGFNGPKGMFPIIPITGETLFQLLAEKVVKASKQAGRQLFIAIMTSPLNDAETKLFFTQNQLFGLQKEQLFFFTQSTLPFLDEKGNLFLEKPDMIAEGPDGNGGIFEQFSTSGLWGRLE